MWFYIQNICPFSGRCLDILTKCWWTNPFNNNPNTKLPQPGIAAHPPKSVATCSGVLHDLGWNVAFFFGEHWEHVTNPCSCCSCSCSCCCCCCCCWPWHETYKTGGEGNWNSTGFPKDAGNKCCWGHVDIWLQRPHNHPWFCLSLATQQWIFSLLQCDFHMNEWQDPANLLGRINTATYERSFVTVHHFLQYIAHQQYLPSTSLNKLKSPKHAFAHPSIKTFIPFQGTMREER